MLSSRSGWRTVHLQWASRDLAKRLLRAFWRWRSIAAALTQERKPVYGALWRVRVVYGDSRGNSVDVIEIDAATNRGIDEIRELREGARYQSGTRPLQDLHPRRGAPDYGRGLQLPCSKLWKSLGAHCLHDGDDAAGRYSADIRSRCQHFSFHAVKFEQILTQLRDLAGREKIARMKMRWRAGGSWRWIRSRWRFRSWIRRLQ